MCPPLSPEAGDHVPGGVRADGDFRVSPDGCHETARPCFSSSPTCFRDRSSCRRSRSRPRPPAKGWRGLFPTQRCCRGCRTARPLCCRAFWRMRERKSPKGLVKGDPPGSVPYEDGQAPAVDCPVQVVAGIGCGRGDGDPVRGAVVDVVDQELHPVPPIPRRERSGSGCFRRASRWRGRRVPFASARL